MGKSKDKGGQPVAVREYSLTINLGDLVDSVEAINALTEAKPNGVPPSAVFGMTIARLMTAMQPHIKNYNKVLGDLRTKYLTSVQDEAGNPVPGDRKEFTPENKTKFEAELEDLQKMEIPLPVGMLPLSALVNEGIHLSGMHLYALRWWIKWDVAPLFVAPDPAPATE